MAIDKAAYVSLQLELTKKGITLVAVSKTKPVADILELYALGQRDFGENYVQELVDKAAQLPADIRWHFIGHLQTNKVKYIVPFVHLIHGVDSEKLLAEIHKQGARLNRVTGCLLQVHIAREETKFGLDKAELDQLMQRLTENDTYAHVMVRGLMGMASFSENTALVEAEFRQLHAYYKQYEAIKTSNCSFDTLSMGMSGDYKLAMAAGSNLVRIGSLLFGSRT
ncbi:MAG: YggS family pyridoxal phosphate-dependent enzyme [Chitinophagales bacterium]|nr:YggS family pyridoxal phosphate-dependent enzyme [Chitinophagales bacterium]